MQGKHCEDSWLTAGDPHPSDDTPSGSTLSAVTAISGQHNETAIREALCDYFMSQ
jgi:hypothetical protein